MMISAQEWDKYKSMVQENVHKIGSTEASTSELSALRKHLDETALKIDNLNSKSPEGLEKVTKLINQMKERAVNAEKVLTNKIE